MKQMKSLIIATSALALSFSGAAFADDHAEEAAPALSPGAVQFEQGCNSYKAEYGTEADCTCLAEKFDANPDFAAEMMTVMGPEDIATLSEDTLGEIAACEAAEPVL
jgi:hypothetical protein